MGQIVVLEIYEKGIIPQNGMILHGTLNEKWKITGIGWGKPNKTVDGMESELIWSCRVDIINGDQQPQPDDLVYLEIGNGSR